MLAGGDKKHSKIHKNIVTSLSDFIIKKKVLNSNFRAGKNFGMWFLIMNHGDCASLCVARLEPQKQLAAPKKPAV